MTKTEKAEHDAWTKLCEMLREAGAVTAEDLASPSARRDTTGQRILAQVRHWGSLQVDLDVEGE